MKIIVKKLQGGECSLDVLPTTPISEIKRQVAESLGIPVEEQKLLLLGRTLADEQTVEFYPLLKEGTKLNLVVKKPDGLFEAAVKYFKNLGLSEKEAIEAGNRTVKIFEEKIYSMSWDDLNRLCHQCLLEERGMTMPIIELEPDCDDTFGL